MAASSYAPLGEEHVATIPAELLRSHVVIAQRQFPAFDELRSERRFSHGTIIGLEVYQAVIFAHHDPSRASIARIRQDISDRLKGIIQIEPRTMTNTDGLHHRMRPAAHLWAAFIASAIQGEKTFPCRKAGLGKFLALAEDIRSKAETSKAPRSPRPIMSPGEALTLPAQIAANLPLTALKIAPPTASATTTR